MKLKLHNFLSHRDKEIDITDNEFYIVHGRNGVGKSGLFDAITYALYEVPRAPYSDKIGNAATGVRQRESHCSVEFTDSLNSIIIKRESGKSFLSVDQNITVSGNNSITRNSKRHYEGEEAQAIIRQIYAPSYEIFCATSYLRQRPGSLLLTGTATEKIELMRYVAIHDDTLMQIISKTSENIKDLKIEIDEHAASLIERTAALRQFDKDHYKELTLLTNLYGGIESTEDVNNSVIDNEQQAVFSKDIDILRKDLITHTSIVTDLKDKIDAAIYREGQYDTLKDKLEYLRTSLNVKRKALLIVSLPEITQDKVLLKSDNDIIDAYDMYSTLLISENNKHHEDADRFRHNIYTLKSKRRELQTEIDELQKTLSETLSMDSFINTAASIIDAAKLQYLPDGGDEDALLSAMEIQYNTDRLVYSVYREMFSYQINTLRSLKDEALSTPDISLLDARKIEIAKILSNNTVNLSKRVSLNVPQVCHLDEYLTKHKYKLYNYEQSKCPLCRKRLACGVCTVGIACSETRHGRLYGVVNGVYDKIEDTDRSSNIEPLTDEDVSSLILDSSEQRKLRKELASLELEISRVLSRHSVISALFSKVSLDIKGQPIDVDAYNGLDLAARIETTQQTVSVCKRYIDIRRDAAHLHSANNDRECLMSATLKLKEIKASISEENVKLTSIIDIMKTNDDIADTITDGVDELRNVCASLTTLELQMSNIEKQLSYGTAAELKYKLKQTKQMISNTNDKISAIEMAIKRVHYVSNVAQCKRRCDRRTTALNINQLLKIEAKKAECELLELRINVFNSLLSRICSIVFETPIIAKAIIERQKISGTKGDDNRIYGFDIELIHVAEQRIITRPSGGEECRLDVAITCVLSIMSGSKIFILDETMKYFDTMSSRTAVLDVLRTIKGKTIMLVDHVISEDNMLSSDKLSITSVTELFESA